MAAADVVIHVTTEQAQVGGRTLNPQVDGNAGQLGSVEHANGGKPVKTQLAFSSIAEWFDVNFTGDALELEYAERPKLAEIPDQHVALRFVADGYKYHSAFVVILPELKTVTVRDHVRMRFLGATSPSDHSDSHEAWWNGVIIPNLDNIPRDRMCIYLKAPSEAELVSRKAYMVDPRGIGDDDDDSEYEFASIPSEPIDPEFFNDVIDPKGITDECSMREALARSSTFLTAVQYRPDDTMKKRHRRGIEAVRVRIAKEKIARDSSTLESILLGDKVDQLPKLNMFAGLDHDELSQVTSMLRSDQMQSYHNALVAPGGVNDQSGPGGTGKTTVMARFACGFAKKELPTRSSLPSAQKEDIPDVVHPQQTIDGLRIPFTKAHRYHALIMGVAQSNTSVDHMALSLYGHMSAVNPNAIVLRLYSQQTDHKILKLQDRASGFDPLTNKVVDDLHVLHIQLSSGNRSFQAPTEDDSTSKHKGRLPDPRVRAALVTHSLGYAMYVAAGLPVHESLADDEHVKSLQKSTLGQYQAYFRRFRELFKGHLASLTPSGLKMDPKAQAEFQEECKILRRFVLRHAHAVCMTMAHAIKRKVHEVLRPHVIFVDEAATMNEVEMACILGLYETTQLFHFFGDERQSGPHVRSDGDFNPYVDQLKMSPFERRKLLGWQHNELRYQSRFPTEINDLVSPIFYNGRLEALSETSTLPAARKALQASAAIFGKEGRVVAIDTGACQKSRDIRKTKGSWRNAASCTVVGAVVRQLLAHVDGSGQHSYNTADLAAITPYKQQNQDLQGELKSVVREHRSGERYVDVHTIRFAQGWEYDVVIVDLVIAKRLGFVNDAKLLCVAVTRARFLLVVVGNMAAIQEGIWKDIDEEKNAEAEYRALTDLIRYLHESDNVVRVVANRDKQSWQLANA